MHPGLSVLDIIRRRMETICKYLDINMCQTSSILISVMSVRDQSSQRLSSSQLQTAQETVYSKMSGWKNKIMSNCFYLFRNENGEMDVHAGSLNPRLMRVQERKISYFIPHPNYDNVSQYFDVALVFLEKVSSLYCFWLTSFYANLATRMECIHSAHMFTNYIWDNIRGN